MFSAEISVDVNTSTTTKENSKGVNTTPISIEKAEVVHIADAEIDELMLQSVPIWLQRGKITLHFTNKETILQGSMLNDVIINAAQVILKEQFPDLLGFPLCYWKRSSLDIKVRRCAYM